MPALSSQETSDVLNSARQLPISGPVERVRKLAAHDQLYLDETPSWFPDGKRIAFQSNRTGQMEVWVMNADGPGQGQVTVAKQR